MLRAETTRLAYDIGERLIKSLVARGRRVHREDAVEVRVDAATQREIHQRRAGNSAVEINFGHAVEFAAAVLQREKKKFLDEPDLRCGRMSLRAI